jgi:hypothetical protein
MNKADIFTQ